MRPKKAQRQARQTADAPASDVRQKPKLDFRGLRVDEIALNLKVPRLLQPALSYYRQHRSIIKTIAIISIILLVVLLSVNFISRYLAQRAYELSPKAELLLGEVNNTYAQKIEFSPENKSYIYNEDYQPSSGNVAGEINSPRFSASFNADPSKGTHIIDPYTQASMTIKPKYKLGDPDVIDNRIVYPLPGNSGAKVLTLHASNIKDDIILESYQGDSLEYKYELQLGEGLEARLESNGSLGIYGPENTVLLGDVSANGEADTELLQQARENSAKNKLIFSIPAPFIIEAGKKTSTATAHFTLDGNNLSVHADGLEGLNYPISIDPSVYIETAAKLMRGNNETNTDFDTNNELIQKSQTTGARIDEWTSTQPLNDPRWNHGTAVAGGYMYTAGGRKTAVNNTTYTSAGADTYTVPAGVTEITIKTWGAGGGGGGGGTNGAGGAGGGGGFSQATISVTPSETLNVVVGGGGGAGDFSTGSAGNSSGDGGGGGGHSEVNRSGTVLIAAGGGGGGGGGDNSSSTPGGAGGAGGGDPGQNGSASSNAPGGNGATDSSGGAGGNAAENDGTAGSSEQGGLGADGATNNSCTDGSKNNGGINGGGDGGTADECDNGFGAGGGGGSGYYGGGGGSSSISGNAGGGGGGGGSSHTTGTAISEITGSGSTPASESDTDRGGAGDGGSGGGSNSSGTAGDDGIVVISYLSAGDNGPRDDVYWARFNSSTNAVDIPNPGNGSCPEWCTNEDYNLPDAREAHSMVAYNGYLYVIGGNDDTGSRVSTIYIAKIGANGEPQLWHPTDDNKANWVYWYSDSGLNGGTARNYLSAVAYNNRMYVLGGQTNASPGGVTTVEMADILPNGKLGSWTTTGMQSLPSGAGNHMHDVHVYNDTLYAIGGFEGARTSTSNLRNTVYYSRLNSDGTMNSWQSTKSFTSARASFGGTFSYIWGAYIYMGGGCTAVNASGYCTTVASDMQLASINADGSLDDWRSLGTLSNQLIGYSLVGWQNGIYRVGGCAAQDTATGDCTNTYDNVDYGVINPAGEVSTVNITESSGTAPCSGGSPQDCDLPPPGDDAGEGGQMLSATVIMNGYLYVIGGCIDYDCSGSNPAGDDSNASGNVSYVSVGSDGSLQKPSSCSGTSYGAWCVDSTNRVNGTTGVAAAGVTTFNNRIYIVGGLTGSGNTTDIYWNTTNPDGSLSGAWSSIDMTTAGISEDVAYTYAYARSNPSAASTSPGNLYLFGGCGGTSGAGCTGNDYETEVYKCNIGTTGSVTGCTTSGQLQIDSTPGYGSSTDGLGIHSGTVYANYIFLIGGYSQYESDKDDVIYAKFDDNNNVVAVSGSDWIESPNKLSVGRRRGWAFGYNGHIYSVGGYDDSGTGIIPFIEWSKMNVSDGSINPFTTSSVTINQRWGLSMAVSNSFAYVVGGCDVGASPNNCTSFEPSIQTFQLYNNDSGAPESYSAGANLFATDRVGASAAVLDGYIYIAGGCTSTSDCTNATNSVQYAPLDAYGNIGTWSSTTANLPADRTWGQLEAAGGSLYYIGGQNDTATSEQSTVYYATPSSGDVSTWSTASNGLPAARTQFSSAVWNDRIYVTGGKDSSGNETNTVYVSPQLSSGGNITSAWSSDTDVFDVARSGHTTIAYANNLYLLGGYDGSNYLTDVQFAQINSDGTLDPWTFSTRMPESIRQGDGFAANGYLYIIGGRTEDNVCESNTLVAPISANTTIASGNNPTGVGEWFETNQKYSGDRYGNTVVYENGKAYVLGGACNVASDPVVNGTYTFDSDGDSDEGAWTWVSDNGPDGLNSANTARAWSHDTNDTASSNVGPTSGQGGSPDGYVYTESSSPAAGGDTFTATLNTTLDASSYDWNVEFYWNQRGDDNLATVTVQTNENGGGWVTRGTYGSGGPDVGTGGTQIWNYENLDLSSVISNASTQVRFRVTLGNSGNIWNNDFGLDTITVTGSDPTPSFAYTGSNRVQQTTLNSQPMVAKYSRMIDLDSDVFPTKWLMNGLDNDIGARWQMSYRSMNDTDGIPADCGTSDMTTWGQVTKFGDVTLGNPETYTPKDSSGTDIDCARYFYFWVEIDASQTFGYPEDVNRGPTIDDLSLFYTADPSKRLRHGKTYTGGEQQPLDTPF